jgi:hypothetical protein
VRKGRLQQAMVVRRFFSDEAERNARGADRNGKLMESSRIG